MNININVHIIKLRVNNDESLSCVLVAGGRGQRRCLSTPGTGTGLSGQATTTSAG